MQSIKTLFKSLPIVGGVCIASLLGACTNSDITRQEALDFLYSYMPLPDRVDYDTAFYQRNIAASLQARREMPWGESVPKREFMHFVLPVRVNNENMDDSRTVFYNELKERVRGLSMQEAILEVNHWCHEHVTYQPTDERTSAPLATARTAFGRCGEESTFTVAALRSVGIPARQVYTPRWAHTDDNHAWVEAWADGQWHFLGACEPEAVLDLGWFNAPASRGMLMHTKAFGHYDGPEEVMSQNNCYTEINVTANYAPVTKAWIKVVDTDGIPVPEANVEYKIYNYAEFYTVSRKLTDENGLSSIEAGRGDLLAWAAKDNNYGFNTMRLAEPDTTVIVIDKTSGQRYSTDIDIMPPVERNTVPALTDEQRQANASRLAYEDSIRNAYISTFNTSTPLLTRSRGNHTEIKAFLHSAKNGERALGLLNAISDKDLRDISCATLMDCYNHTPDVGPLPKPYYYKYVLSPRVANEMVAPHREFLSAALKSKGITSATKLLKWIRNNVRIDSTHNPQNLRMLPTGVWRYRTTDEASLGIFFVAACRTLGIPARIDPVTSKVQYVSNDSWQDVNLGQNKTVRKAAQGSVKATYMPADTPSNPRYYTHFTLSRLDKGFPVLLNYGEEDSYESLLHNGTQVDAADYLLVTGTRLANGSVLAHIEIFPVEEQGTTVPLIMRHDNEQLQVIGSLNSESIYEDMQQGRKSILSTTGRGYYIIGMIAPGEEPTNHILRDISACRSELEAWGRTILLLFRNAEEAARFCADDFPELPSNVVFGIDTDGSIAAEMQGALPVVKIADTFNRVVFSSQGYTIGLGQRLVKATGRI